MTERRVVGWAALGAVLVAAAVLLQWAGRETTFFYDDWPYVLDRGAWTLDALLEPHNEHLQVVSVLVYKVLFETVGLDDYGAYRLVLVVLGLLTAALLFAYARPRVGWAPALGVAACLVVMGPSWYNLVYAFQVNFVGAAAAGMGALLAFDRRTRRGDAAGCALLCVALASSSVGFPFLIGAAIETLLRPDRLRRLWVVATPAALYGVWLLAYGDGRSARASNIDAIPRYVVDGYDDSVAAITGLTLAFAIPVAAALLVLVARELADPERRSPRLVALVAMPLSLWALTALGRADVGVEADANRYLYVSGLLVGLVAVEAARRYPLRGRAVVLVAALLGFGALHNASQVAEGGNVLRVWSGSGKDAATALDLARGRVPPTYADADPTQGFIEARRYYAAVDRYGSSPGLTLEELERAPEERRAGTDDKLLRVLQFGTGPVAADARPASVPPTVIHDAGGTTTPGEPGCLRFAAEAEGAVLEVEVPPRGLFARAGTSPVELRFRRFATGWPEPARATISPDSAAGFSIPPDRSPRPWQAQFRSGAGFEVCAS